MVPFWAARGKRATWSTDPVPPWSEQMNDHNEDSNEASRNAALAKTVARLELRGRGGRARTGVLAQLVRAVRRFAAARVPNGARGPGRAPCGAGSARRTPHRRGRRAPLRAATLDRQRPRGPNWSGHSLRFTCDRYRRSARSSQARTGLAGSFGASGCRRGCRCHGGEAVSLTR